ncbi:MAG: hypothetical protein QOD74_484 [Variibacter sp.]|jgi:hypothetical protein|nr:hypothetical protein [Variibacter sp.]
MTRFFAALALALVVTSLAAGSVSAKPDWHPSLIDNGYGRGSSSDVGG